DGHHRIADELLDGAAVERDQPLAALEVAGKDLANVLCIARLRECGEADEVGEDDRHEAALRGWRRGLTDRNGIRLERVCARAAEAHARLVRSAALRARSLERRRATPAEPSARAVLGTAVRTDHRGDSLVREHTNGQLAEEIGAPGCRASSRSLSLRRFRDVLRRSVAGD